MATKKKMSPKTKKILLGFGIGGGTVLVFLISFFMALYFIINPIVWNDPAILAENRNLRDENEAMKEELAELTDSDEDDSTPSGGGSGQSTPVTPERPTEITPSGDSNSENGSGTSDEEPGEVTDRGEESGEGTVDDTSGEEPEDDTPAFNPETEVTPEGGRPNDGETDITTIVLD